MNKITVALLLSAAVSISAACSASECQNNQNRNDLPPNTSQSEGEEINSPLVSHSQFSEEVPYPRLEVYLHITGGHYFINISDELEKKIQSALEKNIALDGLEPNYEVLGHEWYSQDIYLPQILYARSSEERSMPIIMCADGRAGLGFDYIEATDAVAELISLTEDVMGWDLDVDLHDFSDLVKIEAWVGDSFLFDISDESQLRAFEEFLKRSVVSDIAKNTQDQVVELRCITSDDKQLSIFADPWRPMLWLPPSSYYVYSKTDQKTTEELMTILGIESWPKAVLELSDYPYPDEYFNSTYERLGLFPPS